MLNSKLLPLFVFTHYMNFDMQILLKNGLFFHLFLSNIGTENEFYYILEQKNAFLGYKNTKSKQSKNWYFS